jgi:formate hydrogenlyase subunit 4
LSVVTLKTPELFARLIVETSMSKRLKKFIYRSIMAVLFLGVVEVIYDQIGPLVAGDYFTLIGWGIQIVVAAIFAFIGWRLCVGIRSGYLLFDDLDD